MQTSKQALFAICATAIATIVLASPNNLPAQTASASTRAASSTTQVSVQVARVDPGDLGVEPAFQVAIYENLLQELNKTKKFNRVLRDGERRASETPNLLILKTTIVKYIPGSETRRAVTTVSGATKLTVRSELCTVDGKVVLDRSVNGDVRFFGSNLRATHNLAKNIANAIKKSSWSPSEQAHLRS